MEYTQRIGNVQWARIYEYVRDFKGLHTGNESSTRQFVEGVFWMLRSGSQWRLLPKEYGHWNPVYQRFSRWCEKGVFHKMLYYFQQDADMEYIMVDSTILRAHACASPAQANRKKKD
jgi:putative transposase